MVSSLSYGSTPVLYEEEEGLQRLDEDETDTWPQEDDSVPPKMELLHSVETEPRHRAWGSRAETESSSNADALPQSKTEQSNGAESNVRSAPRSSTAQSVESNLMARPDTAR